MEDRKGFQTGEAADELANGELARVFRMVDSHVKQVTTTLEEAEGEAEWSEHWYERLRATIGGSKIGRGEGRGGPGAMEGE